MQLQKKKNYQVHYYWWGFSGFFFNSLKVYLLTASHMIPIKAVDIFTSSLSFLLFLSCSNFIQGKK